MLLNHSGKSPKIDRSAWIAPDATVCGNVTIGPGSRILHGARVIAEARGEITIGRYCIVMENAVLRATSRHACKIGDHCLIGPSAHVVVHSRPPARTLTVVGARHWTPRLCGIVGGRG